MSRVREQLEAFADAIKDLQRGYEAKDKFGKIRVWIVGAIGLDVIATLVIMAVLSSPPLNVDAWYEEAFPSNVILLRNQGNDLSDVEIIVDNKYRARVHTLERGATGFEIDRDFRDPLDFPPPGSYAPKVLEIRTRGERKAFELRAARKKP